MECIIVIFVQYQGKQAVLSHIVEYCFVEYCSVVPVNLELRQQENGP